MKIKSVLFLLFCFMNLFMNAQSDFSSPYSIYGIGQENLNFFGGLSAMGNTGISYKSKYTINQTNPASLTSIPKNTFLYEVGFNNTFSTKKDTYASQQDYDFNFTHLAMAFPVNNYWGMSLGIVPYSKVSYQIDVVQPIEGSTGNYMTNVVGSGGINELFWGHGFKLTNNFSAGVEIVGLFGSISQEQWILLGTNSAYLNDKNVYFSLGANAGIQYSLNSLWGTKTTLGATVSLPTTLRGAEASVGMKSNAIISNEFNQNADDFDLPLKIGVGISSQINKYLLVNADYRKNYWNNINQSNNASVYSDQSIYGVGFEFQPSSKSNNYWNRLKYRVGANYDSGYVNISNQNVDKYSFSMGLGFPVSANNFSSSININYSYGKEGTTNNGLIQDNFHKLSLNLSLLGNWFQKPKIF
ncbi:MAG: hypothetical protein Q7T92_15060 [Lutibacter sp.]|nr:hypothetical protein [Lutibacter sp.]